MNYDEKNWDWGQQDEVIPMIYTVYFENDEWDDHDNFDNYDEAIDFMEEMTEKHGCKCRLEEREDWDKWHEMYD